MCDEGEILNEEKGGQEQRIVDEKLIEMSAKILNMRKKLNSVNSRFAYVKEEMSDQREYAEKLAKIKSTLELQENLLKEQLVLIAQKCANRTTNAECRHNSSSAEDGAKPAISELTLQKAQKEKYNKMLKLRNEIESLRIFEKFQTEKLEELRKIKDFIVSIPSEESVE